MNRIRMILLVLAVLAPSWAAAQQAMKYEEAATLLGASCGKDIDDNCRGVNLDPNRLKECLNRNQDVVSPKCQADSTRAFSAIQARITARITLMKLCNWEMNHLCSDAKADPSKALLCLLDQTKKATGNCNKAIAAAGYR